MGRKGEEVAGGVGLDKRFFFSGFALDICRHLVVSGTTTARIGLEQQ